MVYLYGGSWSLQELSMLANDKVTAGDIPSPYLSLPKLTALVRWVVSGSSGALDPPNQQPSVNFFQQGFYNCCGRDWTVLYAKQNPINHSTLSLWGELIHVLSPCLPACLSACWFLYILYTTVLSMRKLADNVVIILLHFSCNTMQWSGQRNDFLTMWRETVLCRLVSVLC